MPVQTINILLFSLVLAFFTVSVFTYILYQDERNKRLFAQGKLNPFQPKKRFLTGNERKLCSLLKDSPELRNFHIFPQLHLSTILEVKDEANDLAGKFDWINKLYVDFVIFDKEMNPLLVIELNDSTHLWNSRKSRDEFVRKALEENNFQFLELRTIDLTNPNKLREKMVVFLSS